MASYVHMSVPSKIEVHLISYAVLLKHRAVKYTERQRLKGKKCSLPRPDLLEMSAAAPRLFPAVRSP